MGYKELMEVAYLGKTDFKIKGKNVSLMLGENKLTVVRDDPFIINGPGEYEVSDVLVLAIAVGQSLVFRITIDGLTFCHLDSLTEKIAQEKLERLGSVDILLLPTVDQASKIAMQFDPKIVIPMLNGTVSIEKFLEDFGKKDLEPVDKLSTSVDKLPGEMTVVYLKG